MSRTIEALQIILPVLLALSLGVLCRSRGLISRSGVDALKTVAVNIGLPAVLLHTFAAAEYSLATLIVPLCMYLVCILAWLLGKLAVRTQVFSSPFLPFLTTGFEAGMLGYTLFTLLYGKDSLADFARVDLGQVLFVFTLYKLLLGLNTDNRSTPRQLIREMVFSPIILAILGGVLLGATGLYRAMVPSGLAGLLDACTDFLSAPVSVLILIAVGYDLVFREVPWRETLKAVVLRTVIMAVLGAAALFLFRSLWPESRWDHAVVLMFMLPPPFVLPVFSREESQRAYVSSVLSLSTLLTVAGFIVLAAVG